MSVFSSLLFLLLLIYLQVLPHPTAAAADEEIAESNCPRYFDCRSHRQLTFPYTNTTSPSCGLCMLNCNQSVIKLQLGSVEYKVKKFSGDETVKVIDKQLQLLKGQNSCKIFNHSINLPNTPSIAFTFFPNITLMKCPKLAYGEPPYPEPGFILRNPSCFGFAVYSLEPQKLAFLQAHPPDIPPICELITLPAVDRPSSGGDLFAELADEFTIGFHVSNQCRYCIEKGLQCPPAEFPSSSCIREVVSVTKGKEGIPRFACPGCISEDQVQDFTNFIQSFPKHLDCCI